MIDKLESAEMWFYRRMLRISWKERITNEEVLRRVHSGRTMLKEIMKRRMKLLGHVMRKGELECLVTLLFVDKFT